MLFSIRSITALGIDYVHYNLSKIHPDPNQQYHVDLLTLVLETSRDKYADYQLVPVTVAMLQGRALKMLQQGKLSMLF